MPDRVRIVCPNCGDTIATLPEGRKVEDPLICSNCGQEVRTADPVERAVEKIKHALE